MITNKLVIQDEEDRYFDDQDEVDIEAENKEKESGLAEGEYDY